MAPAPALALLAIAVLLAAGCHDDAPAPQVTLSTEAAAPVSAPDDAAHASAAIARCLALAKASGDRDLSSEPPRTEFLHLSQDEFDHAPLSPLHLSRPQLLPPPPPPPAAAGSSWNGAAVTPMPPLPAAPTTNDRPLECWRVRFRLKSSADAPADPNALHIYVVQNSGQIQDCGVVSILPPQ